VENSDRFHGKTEAGTVSLAAVAQSERSLVFGKERVEEIEFRAEILWSVS